jgi:hypothetical protein
MNSSFLSDGTASARSAASLPPHVPADRPESLSDLVTLDEIAEMHRCSVKHAREVLVNLPGFPILRPVNGRPRWSRQEFWNFVHRKPLDAPGEQSLYRHFDAAGELLYVGVSISAVARLSEHARASRWASQIARVDIERHPTREAALAAEAAAIKAERPRYNTQHNRSRHE